MTGPEVRCFRLAGSSAYVRAEVCEARYPHNTLALTLEGDEDMRSLHPHYLSLELIKQLGPQSWWDLTLWLGDHGIAAEPDVRADREREARLLKQAEAREFRNDGEEW